MSDPNIKQLTVTGNAAESFLNKGSRKRRRSSANKTQRKDGPVQAHKQEGGTSPGTIVQIQANKAPDAPALGPDAISQAKASNSSALAKTTTNSTPATVSQSVTETKDQVGGKKPVKVILAQGKKKGTKVILSPAKVRKLPAPSEKAKTRKVAKKIRMSLNGFGKRVTRANTIRKEATKQPIAEVKKTLVTAKLIKPDSKAPEDILRKMYADYMMLKNRAL
jgi:uncharacterized ParB-like nuclease family protein